ncbi:hypothetical protein HMPREF1415_00522 [Helicobacter pylori GAM254Ai]|nr:hypothetical protein HMPREF1415_00522 [Helicobacter pylori GAM254Ai]
MRADPNSKRLDFIASQYPSIEKINPYLIAREDTEKFYEMSFKDCF